MKTRFTNLFYIFLGVFALCTAIFLCGDGLDDRKETRTNLFFQYYSIEPESILEVIDAKKDNVFSAAGEEQPSILPGQKSSVVWEQDDYLRIVNALFQFARDDIVNDGWRLESMSFSSNCEGFDGGFSHGDFHFYKLVKNQEKESRIERIVNIDLPNKMVLITENEFYPVLANLSGIDLSENLLSASEALQVAENANGKEKRLSVENDCHITLLLARHVGFWDRNWWWWVQYSRTDEKGILSTFYSLDINPYTGDKH